MPSCSPRIAADPAGDDVVVPTRDTPSIRSLSRSRDGWPPARPHRSRLNPQAPPEEQPLRACIFITDLAKVASHGDALVSRASALAGVPAFDEVCFVGCRQSRPLDKSVTAYQPYVTTDMYSAMRVANALFRLVDAKAAPAVAARAGLSVCAPAMIEAILACDPDFVLLDVSWGGYLKALLDADLPGRVCVSGHQTPASRPCAPFQPDPEASVSIVLPTHNGTTYIRRSIESCLAQSHARLELIVVDDGSTEDMGAIVSEFDDPRIPLRSASHEQGHLSGVEHRLRAGHGRLPDLDVRRQLVRAAGHREAGGHFSRSIPISASSMRLPTSSMSGRDCGSGALCRRWS